MRIHVPDEHLQNPSAYTPSLAPDIVNGGRAFSRACYEHCTLSLREAEAARARTAEINGCQICLNFRADRDLPLLLKAFGVNSADNLANRGPAPDEEFYRNVSFWDEYPNYSEREKLAIIYAEGLGLRPKEVSKDDAFWKKFKAHYTDQEIVQLTYCIACWIGLGRATHVLGLDEACAWIPNANV